MVVLDRWTSQHDTALEYAWNEYRTWAATARQQKGELTAWRFRVLGLTLGGALLGAVGPLLGEVGMVAGLAHAVTVGGGLLVALAGFFTKEVLSPERERRWVRARAVAERVKSDLFVFRTQAPPFDGHDAPALLIDRVGEHVGSARSIERVSHAPEPAPTGPLTTAGYIERRVQHQIDYYRERVMGYEEKLATGRRVSLGLGAVAVVLGALGAWAGALIAVVTTAVASITTYLHAEKYRELLVSYQAAAGALEAARRRWEVEARREVESGDAGPADREPADGELTRRHALVAACEAVLREENGSWMGRWLGDTERPAEAKPV